MKIWQAVALLMIAIGLGAAQDRLAETLRKGVVEEEKNQNLNAAIQAYQSILSQFDQDRPTAATALFRLAECYRKQGKSDLAIAAYKRVASEFQDQTKLAEQSRTVLAQTLKVPPVRAAGAVTFTADNLTVTANAVTALQESYRRRVKELMEKQLAIMKEKVAYPEQQYELGASNEVAVAEARNELLQAQRRLAEVDFGPAGPSTAEAAAATGRFWRLR